MEPELTFDGIKPEGIVPHWHDGFGNLGRVGVRVAS